VIFSVSFKCMNNELNQELENKQLKKDKPKKDQVQQKKTLKTLKKSQYQNEQTNDKEDQEALKPQSKYSNIHINTNVERSLVKRWNLLSNIHREVIGQSAYETDVETLSNKLHAKKLELAAKKSELKELQDTLTTVTKDNKAVTLELWDNRQQNYVKQSIKKSVSDMMKCKARDKAIDGLLLKHQQEVELLIATGPTQDQLDKLEKKKEDLHKEQENNETIYEAFKDVLSAYIAIHGDIDEDSNIKDQIEELKDEVKSMELELAN